MLSAVEPLRIIKKHRALRIRPSAVFQIQDDADGRNRAFEIQAQHRVVHLGQIIRSLLLGELLVFISVALGVFTYRITLLHEITPNVLLDTIFAKGLPNSLAFLAALVAGNIVALAFFTRIEVSDSNGNPDAGGRRLLFVLGAIIAILGADLLLLDLSLQELVSLRFNSLPARLLEILYAQGGTALLVLIFTPIHRHFAPIVRVPSRDYSQRMRNILGWGRVWLVGMLLIVVSLHLSTYKLTLLQRGIELARWQLGFWVLTVTYPLIGAFLGGWGIFLLTYSPPKFRQVSLYFGLVLLLLAIACTVGIGFAYNASGDKGAYLSAVAACSIATLIFVPIQRLLS